MNLSAWYSFYIRIYYRFDLQLFTTLKMWYVELFFRINMLCIFNWGQQQ